MSLATRVRGPTAMKNGSRGLGLTKLRALKKMLSITAEAMGSSSPEKTLKNFVDIIQSSSPQIKFAILFFTPWAMLITAISKYALIRQSLTTFKDYFLSTIYASVSIPSTHPLNKQILAYFIEHGLGKNARTLALTPPGVTAGSRVSNILDEYPYLYGSDSRRNRNRRGHHNAEEEDRQRAALSYIPEVGMYRFWWKGFPMTFDRQRGLQEQIDAKGRVSYISQLSGGETIVISCPSFFAGTRPIQDFLNHVKTIPGKDNTTTIYRPDGVNSVWDNGITRPSRNLHAVTLDSKVKDDLVKDIETYLSPATRKYYANRGIPWRRGLLFYGNPGTGKTSFTNALAGHLHLNIYMLSQSNSTLTDTMLETLFEQLPSKCIVLLEDIDSAGIQREGMKQQLVRDARRRSKKYGHQYIDRDGLPMTPEAYVGRMSGVTLSGLLNVLDGIHSKEGHVTIMTSNSPDSLDTALVRPGRIDRKVLFGYASAEVIRKLFVHIFSKAPEELLDGEKAGIRDGRIDAFAEQFAEIVPADKLTPAEVQGYLLVHREDAAEAVEQAKEWVEKTLATKEKGVNVEAFAGQEETDKVKEEKRSHRKKSRSSKSRQAEVVSEAEEEDKSIDDDEASTSTSDSSSSSAAEEYSSTSSGHSTPASSYAASDVEEQRPTGVPARAPTASPPTASLFSNQATVSAVDIKNFLETAGIVFTATAIPAAAASPSASSDSLSMAGEVAATPPASAEELKAEPAGVDVGADSNGLAAKKARTRVRRA